MLLLFFFNDIFKISVRKYGGSSTKQKTFQDSRPHHLRNLLSSNVFCSWYGFPGSYKINVIIRKQIGMSRSSSLFHIPLPTQQQELINMETSTRHLFFNQFFLFVCHYIVEPRLTATSFIRSPHYYCHFFWLPGKTRHTFSCKINCTLPQMIPRPQMIPKMDRK